MPCGSTKRGFDLRVHDVAGNKHLCPSSEEADPLKVASRIAERWTPCRTAGLPECFTGGWVGHMGYDTVRYQYINKLPFDTAPQVGCSSCNPC